MNSSNITEHVRNWGSGKGSIHLGGRRLKRGIALVTVLLLTVILLILTVAFLFFAERGYRFAGLQERQNQAYFLAVAGLEFYRARPEAFLAQRTVRHPLPLNSTTDFFEVTLKDDGTLVCKGILYSPLSGLTETETIERVVIVPEGSVEKMYDRSQDL